MRDSRHLTRLIVLSFAAVLLFAVVFAVAQFFGGFPGLPYRALRDLDWAVGLLCVLGVLFLAARSLSG